MKTTTMSEKSHVALQQALCPVCAVKHDTGVIIDKFMRNTLESKVVTHWQMCPEHEKLKSEGYIALVGIDPTRSEEASMNGVFRTGNLAFLKTDRWGDVFTVPAPESGVCFAEDDVIKRLMVELQPDSNNENSDINQQPKI